MLPITLDDNQCLNCHHPEEVSSEEESPIPDTHFERPVMREGKKGEPMVWVVKKYERADDVIGARYNCVQCHTPQAVNVKTPKSLFVYEKPQ